MNKKIIIAVVSVIVILIIVSFAIISNIKPDTNTSNSYTDENGITKNNSDKIITESNVSGLKIKNVSLILDKGNTKYKATIIASEEIKSKTLTVVLYDEKGIVLSQVTYKINSLKANTSSTISLNMIGNFVDAEYVKYTLN